MFSILINVINQYLRHVAIKYRCFAANQPILSWFIRYSFCEMCIVSAALERQYDQCLLKLVKIFI